MSHHGCPSVHTHLYFLRVRPNTPQTAPPVCSPLRSITGAPDPGMATCRQAGTSSSKSDGKSLGGGLTHLGACQCCTCRANYVVHNHLELIADVIGCVQQQCCRGVHLCCSCKTTEGTSCHTCDQAAVCGQGSIIPRPLTLTCDATSDSATASSRSAAAWPGPSAAKKAQSV
jgi:hypothetical protein